MSVADKHFDSGDAATYALGMLDDRRQRALELHAARCEPCARALAAAERDVAALAAAQPQHVEPPMPEAIAVPSAGRRSTSRAPWVWPLAAVFVLTFLSTGYLWQQNRTMQASMSRDEQVVARLNEGPFRTARFHGMRSGAQARVMYAPDGSWYVVLVRGATRALQVAWMHDGTATMLGDARPHGPIAMLYLPKSHRMDRLALMDGGEVVAEAELAY